MTVAPEVAIPYLRERRPAEAKKIAYFFTNSEISGEKATIPLAADPAYDRSAGFSYEELTLHTLYARAPVTSPAVAKPAANWRIVWGGLVGGHVAHITPEGSGFGGHVPSWAPEIESEPSWAEPCEEMFDYLAARRPMRLIEMLSSGELTNAQLSFAAEAVGKVDQAVLAVSALLPLLNHRSAPVREGAVLGLARHLATSEEARSALRRVADADASPAVRDTAADALLFA